MIGWVLLTLGICYGIVESPVMAPVRWALKRLPWVVGMFFRLLLRCLPCVGAWSGLLAAYWMGPGARLGAWWPVTATVMGAGLGFGVLMLSPMNASKAEEK